MARNITTPRFWVNYIQFFEYMNSSVLINTNHSDPALSLEQRSAFNILPVNVRTLPSGGVDGATNKVFFKDFNDFLTNPFMAALGVNRSLGSSSEITIEAQDSDNVEVAIPDGGVDFNSDFNHEGWMIKELTTEKKILQLSTQEKTNTSAQNATVGSIVIGSYYEPPYSPDLSLTLNYDYSGIKRVTTKGGNTLTNTQWNRAPKWGNRGAWELERGQDHNLARTGRRSWKIKFSFFNETDIFPDYTSLASNEATDQDLETLLNGTGNDLYGKLIIPTAGGTLPFIFSPSNSTADLANPDNYAIATIKEKSFSFKQVAYNIYDISFTVVETW